MKLERYLAEQDKPGADGVIERAIVRQEKAAPGGEPGYQLALIQTLGEAAVAYAKLGQMEMSRPVGGAGAGDPRDTARCGPRSGKEIGGGGAMTRKYSPGDRRPPSENDPA